MLDLLSKIADVITAVITFVVHSITTMISLITHIPSYATFMFNIINASIPTIFKPFIISGICIAIVYLIIGRSHG